MLLPHCLASNSAGRTIRGMIKIGPAVAKDKVFPGDACYAELRVEKSLLAEVALQSSDVTATLRTPTGETTPTVDQVQPGVFRILFTPTRDGTHKVRFVVTGQFAHTEIGALDVVALPW